MNLKKLSKDVWLFSYHLWSDQNQVYLLFCRVLNGIRDLELIFFLFLFFGVLEDSEIWISRIWSRNDDWLKRLQHISMFASERFSILGSKELWTIEYENKHKFMESVGFGSRITLDWAS